MNEKNQQLKTFLDAHPEVEIFQAILPDVNARLRGKWLPLEKVNSLVNGRLKLPLSTLSFDIWGRDIHSLVFDDGDADGICIADLNTLVTVPWLERPTAQVFLGMNEVNGEPCAYDPRALLKKLMDRLKSHGLTAVMTSELEFSLFQSDNDEYGRPLHTETGINGAPATGGQTYGIDEMQEIDHILLDIHDASKIQKLPIDSLIAEAAPSQYEINLHHHDNALLAADQSIMLKRVIKGIANKHGLRSSFMAKPFSDLAGNGMHVHCSLVKDDGKNAFNNGTAHGNELLKHAVAGCLATLEDSMLLFAPHLNSYRRFQSESHAPLSPTWGYENRTVAIRIPADDHEAMRLEHRVPGADANIYLVFSAIIAGMLYGIENKMNPSEPVTGDAYSQFEPSLPSYWSDAINVFKNSEFIKEYFGETFRKVFAETKMQEQDEFNQRITLLEYESYL